jgi:predicted transposase YdaD
MAGIWDTKLKILLSTNPEHFVRWLLPEAELQSVVTLKSNNMEVRQLEVDGLLQVVLFGIVCLIHIEFQSYYDEQMAERMWKYNATTSILYDCPVYSVVIYVRKCRTPEPHYERNFLPGRRVHHFYFDVVKLWELQPDNIEQLGLMGIYPLIVLTDGGNEIEVINHLVTEMKASDEPSKKDLIALLYHLASLVVETDSLEEWLRRSFGEMRDFLSESWVYQEILREGQEKGLKEGLEKGMERGLERGLERGREMELRFELERQRLTLTTFVQRHYPELALLAQRKAESIGDPETLQLTIMHILNATTQDQVASMLSEASHEN